MAKATAAVRPDTPGRPDAFFARGFEFYLDGHHAFSCRQDEAAGYLFHNAVELMLKAVLLRESFARADGCVRAARDELIAKEGFDAKLDPKVADACLEQYRQKVEELKDAFVHSLDPLWREAGKVLGKPSLSTLDPIISRIAQWEDFRYPTFHHSRPKVITASPVAGDRVSHRGMGHADRSNVNWGDVDKLVRALMEGMEFSADWVKVHARNEAGLDTYREGNRHLIKGL